MDISKYIFKCMECFFSSFDLLIFRIQPAHSYLVELFTRSGRSKNDIFEHMFELMKKSKQCFFLSKTKLLLYIMKVYKEFRVFKIIRHSHKIIAVRMKCYLDSNTARIMINPIFVLLKITSS